MLNLYMLNKEVPNTSKKIVDKESGFLNARTLLRIHASPSFNGLTNMSSVPQVKILSNDNWSSIAPPNLPSFIVSMVYSWI